MAIRKEFKPERVLRNWRELVKAIPDMTEEELAKALAFEIESGARKDFVLRLHRRHSKLKRQRELQEMMQ